jgi:uncharacterized protein with HEPN domain
MPPTLADRLVHILAAVDTIQTALANKAVDEFTKDILLRLAVERSFEIISEASRRIPDSVKAQQPAIDWLRMADLGKPFARRLPPRRSKPALANRRTRSCPAQGIC